MRFAIDACVPAQLADALTARGADVLIRYDIASPALADETAQRIMSLPRDRMASGAGAVNRLPETNL